MTCLRERYFSGQEDFVRETLLANPNFVCCLEMNDKDEVKCGWMQWFLSREVFKEICGACREELKRMLQIS